MDERIVPSEFRIEDLVPGSFSDQEYDIGAWAAGYEARSSWQIQSSYDPTRVDKWVRVEFVEGRGSHSAPQTLSIGRGELLGGKPGRRNHDGDWRARWESLLIAEWKLRERPLRVFVDYSSMPRTVYGPLVIACTSGVVPLESLTLAYVPGLHDSNVDGSRTIEGLRSLAGLEGRSSTGGTPAFILGLGYDGVLAEAIVELFQVDSFSCMYADPGVSTRAVERARESNRRLLDRSELVRTAPAWDCPSTTRIVRYLCDWYAGRDVVLVPLGPKPQVLAAIIASIRYNAIALRFALTSRTHDVQVTVEGSARPYGTRLWFNCKC